MSNTSDYLENMIIGVFRGSTFTEWSASYVRLYSATPSDVSGSGTEISPTGYSPVNVAPSTGNWAASSGTNGQTSNVNAINFGTWTTGPTTVTHFAIYDASSSGNMICWGALAASKTVAAGDSFSIPANQLTVTIA